MFDIGTVLDLDDNNSYTVISSVKYNNKEYLYLVDLNDNSNMMFVEKLENELIPINDTNLLKNLILLMNDEINNI
ncbi:MAG: hypothetical protein HFI86_07090 [Bacilli bacterium]|nr:hypothetical protein [Bacilli bacterium]